MRRFTLLQEFVHILDTLTAAVDEQENLSSSVELTIPFQRFLTAIPAMEKRRSQLFEVATINLRSMYLDLFALTSFFPSRSHSSAGLSFSVEEETAAVTPDKSRC